MAPKSWAHICESRVLFHVCALYGYLVRFGFGHVSPKPRNIWHVRSCSCSYSAIGYSKYSLVSKNLWRQRRITRAGSAPLRGRTANQSLRAWSSASAAGVNPQGDIRLSISIRKEQSSDVQSIYEVTVIAIRIVLVAVLDNLSVG